MGVGGLRPLLPPTCSAGRELAGPAVPMVRGFNNSQFQMKNLAFCPQNLTLISVAKYARGAFGMTSAGLRGPRGGLESPMTLLLDQCPPCILK